MVVFEENRLSIVSVFAAFCLLAPYGQLHAGYWLDTSPRGEDTSHDPPSESGTSPVKYEKSTSAYAHTGYGTGGKSTASAHVKIDTYGTWMDTYKYETQGATAYFQGERRMSHRGSPSHSGVQGTFRASCVIQVSFRASCFVRTNAQARCSGSASASASILGHEGNSNIEVVNAGSTTASGGYPIGFNVGGTVGGTGGNVGWQGSTNKWSYL